MGIAFRDFYTCDNVRLHATHEMYFHPKLGPVYPIVIILLVSIACIVPTDVTGGAKSRRVNGKIDFYRLETETTFLNKGA